MPEVTRAVSGKSAGRLSNQDIRNKFEAFLSARFGSGPWIEAVANGQIYLNVPLLKQRNLSQDSLVDALKPEARRIAGIRDLKSAAEVSQGGSDELELYQRGLHKERSGDAFLLITEGWLIEDSVAGNHGTSNLDDTRIPMVFSGWGIPEQRLSQAVRADDIAPTILSLVDAQPPAVMTGKSLKSLIAARESK